MNTDEANRIEGDCFELVCFMVTSARNLIHETKLYGPLRLIDSVSRLVSILEKNGIKSERLNLIQKEIEEGKLSVMDDDVAFGSFLEKLVMDLVPLM